MLLNKEVEYLPATMLLPWDLTETADIVWSEFPALLKAPLGSGGNSLYLVQSVEDVVSIVSSHALQARSTPGFLDSLQLQYHRIPSWSLQRIVPSLRINNQKCQFRVYLIALNDEIYAYHQIEVRIPTWNDQQSTDANISTALAFDQIMCANSTALPYNHNRVKTETKRVLLKELNGLDIDRIQTNIRDLMTRAFSSLQHHFQLTFHHHSKKSHFFLPSFHLCELAVGGVDVMVDGDYRPFIVEMNNNPAMPSSNKQMSSAYRAHLITFVKELIAFGMNRNNHDHSSFERLC